jgi:hypothetical protein
MALKIIVVGDLTSHGGRVISGSDAARRRILLPQRNPRRS